MRNTTALFLVSGALLAAGCADLNVANLNNPPIEDLERNPTRAGVIGAAQGSFIGARTNIAPFNGYISELGVLGRESYNFNAGDTRFITELLEGPLDGSSPRFGGNLWNERYANIRGANITLNALDVIGSALPAGLTSAEKEAIRGFVKTMQALDFLLIINTRDTLGAPVDVNVDLTAPLPPFVSRDSVYGYIVGLLNAAVGHLAAGGGSFPFSLPPGFTGFTTPSTFIEFNRALKARVEAYRATLLSCGAPCWTRAMSAIDSSFWDTLTVPPPLSRGAYYDFGTGSGDILNGLRDPTGASQRGHPSLRTQAELQLSGQRDQRFLDKVDSIAAVTRLDHTSDMVFKIYPSTVTPVPIIRNEELILLRAEAEFGLGNQPGAAALINYIRVNSGKLPPRAGLGSALPDTLIAELLKQRQYSLLFEGGHRWIDARRYGALIGPRDSLPNQAGDNIFSALPVPSWECNARGLPNNCVPPLAP
jgi:starch-binding outer membrane protein, SusD/RagB family